MTLHTKTAVILPLFMICAGAALIACGNSDNKSSSSSSGSDEGSTTTTTTTTSGGGGSGGSDMGAGGAGGTPAPTFIKTIAGDMTWNVTFDDAAKAAGATDCLYTRHYEGVEDRSAPWLCPSCEIMFHADVTMTAGKDDCFSQVSMTPPAEQEWIGYGNGTWFRSVAGPTTTQGTATVNGADITTANTVMDLDVAVGGKMQFAIDGAFKLGDQEGDPLHGWVPAKTYTCGWPKADPPPYTGNYVLSKGGELPDGVFRDACDEVVRLHDFKGTYLIVDMSAMDCPPCQAMAGDEEAFVTNMKSQGIDVRVITLLAPSLSNPLGETSKTKLNTWITKYDLTSPVLGDRGWGLSEFEPAFGDQTGYPSWVIVDPSLKILEYMPGYSSFSDFENIILADAKP